MTSTTTDGATAAVTTAVTPRRFFLWISRAEAVTWSLLLLGLFLVGMGHTGSLQGWFADPLQTALGPAWLVGWTVHPRP